MLIDSTPVTCYAVVDFTVDESWDADTHVQTLHEMMVVYGGTQSIRMGDEEFPTTAGDVLICPANTRHGESVRVAPTKFTFIIFSAGLTIEKYARIHDSSGRIRMLTQWLLEEQASSYQRKNEAMDAMFQTVLIEFDKALVSASPDGLAASTQQFMREHIRDPLTVTDLASHAGMSQAHFIRTYGRLTGNTPIRDLQRLRVEVARELIMSTTLPLKSVASRVGLCDEQHLSRLFRRYLNVPPGYFRRR